MQTNTMITVILILVIIDTIILLVGASGWRR